MIRARFVSDSETHRTQRTNRAQMRGRPPVVACFGGGGAFGVGFDMGVARALVEAGIPVSSGPMLGTSAGAWTAARLAVGIDLDEILGVVARRAAGGHVPVIDITRPLFGAARDEKRAEARPPSASRSSTQRS